MTRLFANVSCPAALRTIATIAVVGRRAGGTGQSRFAWSPTEWRHRRAVAASKESRGTGAAGAPMWRECMTTW